MCLSVRCDVTEKVRERLLASPNHTIVVYRVVRKALGCHPHYGHVISPYQGARQKVGVMQSNRNVKLGPHHRTRTTLMESYSIEYGIHAYLHREDAEEAVKRRAKGEYAVMPVIGRLKDLVAAGYFHNGWEENIESIVFDRIRITKASMNKVRKALRQKPGPKRSYFMPRTSQLDRAASSVSTYTYTASSKNV